MCQGQPATIVATKDSQDLRGTPGGDGISTAGHSFVKGDGGEGADLICNPRGKAAPLWGGAGDDRIVTEGLSDLHGGDGDDVLTDQGDHRNVEYPAVLDGGNGADTVRGDGVT